MQVLTIYTLLGLMLLGIFMRKYVMKTCFPYPAVLILLGAFFTFLIGFFHFSGMNLTLITLKPLLEYIFLPVFIYVSVMQVDFISLKHLWKNALLWGFFVPILIMIILAFTFFKIAGNAFDLPLSITLLIAAMLMSITSETIQSFVYKKNKSHIYAILHAESFFSMLVSLIFFQIFLSLYLNPASHHFDFLFIIKEFFRLILDGAFLALILGGLSLGLMNVNRDTHFQVLLIIFMIYLAYFVAKYVHASGSVAIASMAVLFCLMGTWLERSFTHEFLDRVWLALYTLCYASVYVLLGMHTHFDEIYRYRYMILSAFLLIIFIRVIFVFIEMRYLNRSSRKNISVGYGKENAYFMVFGGVRGVLPALLALGFPDDFQYTSVIQSVVFGVILLSVFVQLPSLLLLKGQER
jgi:NhaP-type Na+/H+ or K+/H+ antiporter